jgi:SpoVK/Ycf46/Vps4 family AAA+-type ATPase
VLFIDEAYSLTNGSGRETSYGKECIDTLNQELSENRSKLVVIIAGYENDINQKFFAVNPGLERRFPFRYVLNEYTKDEMKDIFIRMVRLQDNLSLSSDIKNSDIIELFSDMEYFENCGGDIENLITQIEFANNKRSLGKHPNIKGVFIKNDLTKGLKQFKAHKTKNESNRWDSMYM